MLYYRTDERGLKCTSASYSLTTDRWKVAPPFARVLSWHGNAVPRSTTLGSIKFEPALFGPALDRVVAAGLLFRQGTPPHATYLFKHALVQDAAYGTLLREPRRLLHARITETLEVQFADIAESQPELLARHCTEAGLIEKAVGLWGKAGQRSLERSALVEAAEQFKRALEQIATLPATPALRREEINLQVALITPLMHVKGYAAPETKAAAERARLLIEQAQALGEPPEDPLVLFSVLYGFWAPNYVAFNGDLIRDLAAQFLTLAEKQGATVPLMVGHRLMGASLVHTGDIAHGRVHYDQAFALYDPAEHRPLATRFGQDIGVMILSFRSWALWLLGYPDAALADTNNALQNARGTGQAANDLALHSRRDQHRARLGQRLHPRRNIGPAERRLAELENSLVQVKRTSAPPKRCRPHSAIGCSGVFCRSCEQLHSTQVDWPRPIRRRLPCE
jgi:hypothetical protein